MVFVIEMKLPAEIDEKFLCKIPSHRAFINLLINEGKIQSYSISDDRSKGWIIFNTKNETEAIQIMEQLPICEFISYRVNKILIHDSEIYRFPKINMN